jgi:hypothetical protein
MGFCILHLSCTYCTSYCICCSDILATPGSIPHCQTSINLIPESLSLLVCVKNQIVAVGMYQMVCLGEYKVGVGFLDEDNRGWDQFKEDGGDLVRGGED